VEKTKVALLFFADHREDFYNKRRPLVEKYTGAVQEVLAREAELVTFEPIRSLDCLGEIVKTVHAAACDCAILYFPIWVAPNFPTVAANLLNLPILLLTNPELETSGVPGMLSCGASLDQVGIAHRRLWGDIGDPNLMREIRAYLNAARVVRQLRGMRYGMFGGRSLGIYTAAIDPSQWQKIFGIDVEHIDQLEIVRRSEKQPAAEVGKVLQWLAGEGMNINFNDTLFTPSHLEKQIQSYLATRQLVAENKFSFVSVKCQPELSNGFCLQCLNVALLNDLYDADGPKPAVPCACEADGDGALTMMILNGLSGGEPTALMDIRAVLPEEGIMLLPNCGTMATYFASRSKNPGTNFKNVSLVPHVFGEAGGAAVRFVCAPGPMTLARLCRKAGRYWMAISYGETVDGRDDLIARSTSCWPHAVVRTDMDLNDFIDDYGSNHIHGVAGDYRKELVEFCRILGIDYHVYASR
jgi:L-fucose/D-arabinose isomerase